MDEKLVGIANIDIVLYGQDDTFKNPEMLGRIDDFQKFRYSIFSVHFV